MKTNSCIIVGININHTTLYHNVLSFAVESYLNVTFICNLAKEEEFRKRHQSDKIKFIPVKEKALGTVIKAYIKEINKYTVVVIDEIYGGLHNAVFSNLKCKHKVLIIHNINKWFNSKATKSIKHRIKRLLRKRFLEKITSFFVMSPAEVNYLKAFTSKSVFFFPFDAGIPLANSSVLNEEEIRITVPGMIDEKRRNYTDLLNVINLHYQERPNSNISFTFLGKINAAKEEKLYKALSELKAEYDDRIRFWEAYIPTERFQQELINTDIILSNLKVVNKQKESVEIYGITKESGISYIIYKYGKVAICPNMQVVLSGMDKQIVRFSNYHELLKILNRIDERSNYLASQQRSILQNREAFTDLIREELENARIYLRS